MSKRAVVLMALMVVGCGDQQAFIGQLPGDDKATDAVKDDLTLGTNVHVLPMHAGLNNQAGGAPINTLSTNMLKYYGGKVIPNAKVYTVNWGGSVNSQLQAKMPAFYQQVMNSVHVDWLSEYNTIGKNGQDGQPGSNQAIGRGSSGGSITITPSITSSTVDDTQIQSELSKQINNGVLPAPDDNTYYAINFPKGLTITQGGSSSCVQFCAYHGTFMKGSQDVYYGVLPSVESGTGCASGCGANSSFLDNATEVASHELVEAITDAEVGIGTTVGRPLAWYNTSQGEIGDICNGTSGTISGSDGVTYTVQKEYDNATGTCIVSKGTGGGGGTGGGAGGGGGTGGGSGGGGGGSGGGGGTVSDFAIAINPTSASVSAGSSVSFAVSTSVISGSSQTVSLTVSGLPSGVTGSFSPTSVTAGGSSTLTVSASSSAAVATSTLTVKGAAASGSHTTTASLSVTSATGGETALSNGVGLSGQAGAKGAQAFYRVDVPSGASNLVIQISGGSGDADLYTRFGARPSLTTYDCRPYINGNSESCSVPAPAAGSYYVMLNGYAAYSGVTILASYSTGGGTGGGGGGGGGGGDPALSNGVAVGPLSGAKSSSQYFQVTVPAGTSQLVVTTTGSTSSSNDADLYVKQGSHPTASSYACRSWNYGSNEQCTINNPAAGTWYVMIRGYTAYSGVALQADWN